MIRFLRYLLPILPLACLTLSAHALETSVPPQVTALSKTPKTGLFVGNSFTYYNCGVNGYVRGFTKEDGTDWIARMNTISAGRLSFHPVKDYLAKAPQDPYDKNTPKFDVVILQGQSTEPINEKAKDNFQQAFSQHVKAIREAGSEPAIVMTWALQGKPEQTQLLADATTAAANKEGVFVIPAGLAFAESLKGRPDLILHAPDKRHPSAAGSYLYGAVLYGALFKKSPEGLKFLGGCEKPLTPENAAYLQKVAWKTVKDFYGWK